MSGRLDIACDCAAVRGEVRDVSPRTVNYGVCYCDDCQLFAHYLGRADDVLDAHGGTTIFQVSPATVSFHAGVDQIACVRLRPKGLVRWYARCCSTPIGNTVARNKLPMIGIVAACVDKSALAAAAGPMRMRLQGRYARGDKSELGADEGISAGVALRMLGKLVRWRLRGDRRRSPLFDADTLEPISAPDVLEPEVLERLRRQLPGGASAPLRSQAS